MIAIIPIKNIPIPVCIIEPTNLKKNKNKYCCFLLSLGFQYLYVDNSYAFNHLFLLKSRNRQKEEKTCYLCLYRDIAWKAVKVSLGYLN